MKDLLDSLSKELKLTTQEYLQKSKESEKRNMEIAINHSIIINPTSYTTEWENQMNSNEESTTYDNK